MHLRDPHARARVNGPLWLARPGETVLNRAGRMQGRFGSPLTRRGRAQAMRLAAAATRWSVERIVASPLDRAMVTARRVAESTGCPLIACDELREVDFGLCTGLTKAEIERRFPGLLETRRRHRWHHRWPRGESYADVRARLIDVVAGGSIVAPRTLIVAHRLVNRVLAGLLAHAPREVVLEILQRPEVILRFEENGAVSHAPVAEGGEEWIAGFPGAPMLTRS